MHNCVSGPAYYASVVEAAINIVTKSGGKFHTLFVITDDQVEFKYFCSPLLSPLFLSHAVCTETILTRVISFCFKGFKWHQFKCWRTESTGKANNRINCPCEVGPYSIMDLYVPIFRLLLNLFFSLNFSILYLMGKIYIQFCICCTLGSRIKFIHMVALTNETQGWV